ncbi:hypothetical protein B0T18DRAFT_425247 [Schizothecium vesticola]|uniref:Uncharacterized protein n=1 Tax=Schizothecium vesticola TaxID=314040 RepID=A0AA40KD99_9PEZI|nr:hypothetical protein B0T18DRAFT_425247 [Schizothecium vesticola]
MNFLRRGTEPRPYAANSTGQLRGTLRLGTQVRRVQVYEAVGEARAIFIDRLNRAIRDHLRDNLQASANFLVFSLFMVGKSPDRTKPIVMLVSDDKQIRTEAFRMIKDSAIMKDFPGFGLGHMELTAEYENLRPLGSQANPTTVGPDSISFFAPGKKVDVFAGQPSASGEDEGECEIIGLSDDEEEEDELVDITSRGSASPIDTSLGGDMAKLRREALPLESYHHYIETAPSDTAIKTSTPNGIIRGTLSGTPSFVRLPGSKIFQEVYTAMLNRPLVPGDCGSWVKNAITGKLFGHVIAGSSKTGLVLLMPASRLFAGALDALSACDSADGVDVGKLIGFKANVEAVSAEDVTPRPQPSFLASGVDITSDHSALEIWRSTTAAPPRSGEGIHAFPTHNEGEPSGQSKFDEHGKMRLRLLTLDRLAQDLADQNYINGVYTEDNARLIAWLDRLPQTPIGRGSLHQHEAINTDICTPDFVAFTQHFYDTWACPTSPEERERLLEKGLNPPLPQINTSIFGGQYIPCRLQASERIRPASFILGSQGFEELPSVLISSQYQASYIFGGTLKALSRSFVPVKVRPSRNPLGGRLFTPIGIVTLHMKFSEGIEFQDAASPFFVNFLVLDESGADRGVLAILGKPDIERIMGTSNPF